MSDEEVQIGVDPGSEKDRMEFKVFYLDRNGNECAPTPFVPSPAQEMLTEEFRKRIVSWGILWAQQMRPNLDTDGVIL
jgi:hypothetical protein